MEAPMRAKSIVLILLAAVLLTGGCAREEAPKRERPAITGVTVEALAPSRVTEYYAASGTVTARTASAVSSRVMGMVTSIRVQEGDRVRKGDLLLTIDDRDVREKVRAAEEALSEARQALMAAREEKVLAEKTYDRYRQLYEAKALTEQELDTVKTRMEVARLGEERAQAALKRARARLEEARVYLDFTRVVSPTTGVVSEKRIDAGSMAAPGMPLLIVEEPSYRLEVQVDERLLGRVKKGSPAEVTISSLGLTLTGTVSRVVPAVDPASRTFLVKVDIAHPGLRSGLYGRARFALAEREALLVPRGALVRKGQLTGVYLVGPEGVVTYRLIRVGKLYPGGYEVLSGVSSGDRIVVGGVENAVDGGMLKRPAGEGASE
jgi:RND family efflux transporter MFP subunit